MKNIDDTTTSPMSHTIVPSSDQVPSIPDDKASSVSDQTQQVSSLSDEASSVSDKKDRTLPEEEKKQKNQEVKEEERVDSGRERLTKHRREIAGRVWIPEIWGQEDLLKDWIDCSTFDTCLVPAGISSARAALVTEARRAASASGGLQRLDNRCLILR